MKARKNLFKHLIIFLTITLSFSLFAKNTKNSNSITIIQKPIVFNNERIRLTRQYRMTHYGIQTSSIEINPRMIVLHFTCTSTLQDAYNIFNATTLSNRADIKMGGNLNVSAHFLIDRDGKIYQLMPTNWMARHTIGLNNIAIGIENVGGVDNNEDLTIEQIKANIDLISYLKIQHPNIDYIIGHYEYGEFRHTDLWQEQNPNYFTIKKDPGKKFMAAIRAHLAWPSLRSSPQRFYPH